MPTPSKQPVMSDVEQTTCHPERSQGSAFDDASISTEMGAPFLTKSRVGKHERKSAVVIIKSVQALLLAIAVCFSLGATDAGSRFNDLGHRLMCTCGCAQMLGECNHVGCPESGRMRNELSAAIASGLGDKEILDSFANKYGATVLAAPTTQGFNLVAWIAPFAVFLAALLGTYLLVRHWSVGKTQVPAQASNPELDALRARIRRETDSVNDGGF